MQEFGLVAAAFLVLALAADAGRLACGIGRCTAGAEVRQTER